MNKTPFFLLCILTTVTCLGSKMPHRFYEMPMMPLKKPSNPQEEKAWKEYQHKVFIKRLIKRTKKMF